ncbi:peptidyl-prolyl cis-trans isomerase [Candidatus Nitrosoglobus terrae]|uniref:Chaperone SurA n=1 Tax=Candidatus Nitrosoglobus terrae TaxID=1630141 RepID=A0A1Q2SNL4_9GAMM|nr:peptidylprolyl isomerase [Candidatus Nitrosoglobus terrae]BAW80738.1 peptidyl-prolyl cis-trans isomerase [Candidatus Nitrosoglobus terrae]
MQKLLIGIFTLFGFTHSFATPHLDRIVAVANDEIVLESELDQMIRTVEAQLESRGAPLPPSHVLEKQVLDRLIIQSLQLQLADRIGIRVGDDTLNQALQSIAEKNKLTLSQFRDVLEKDGFSYADVRENIRKEIVISQLHKREIDDHITISEAEIDNFLATQKKQGNPDVEYYLAHILIAVPEAASSEDIQAAKVKAEKILRQLQQEGDFQRAAIAYSDGQQALEGGDLGWRKMGQIPTLFVNVVPDLQIGGISSLIRSPSGFHIVKLIDRRGEEEQIITQTHARHILIRADELTGDEDIQIRLNQLRQRALQGESFEKLAKAHSDDKASAIKGGDLGWVSPGQMVPFFEEVMLSLNPGEISKPFRTQFGWHIVQVVDRRKQNMTEEYNRSKAQMAIRQRKIEEDLENWLRQLRDEAYVEYRLEMPEG